MSKKLKASIRPNWCPRCGNYGLLSATIKAISELGYSPNEVVIVSGIGCSSSFPHWTTAYGMHVLHGRALPAAIGALSVNPKLKIIAVGGDGDGYGIGVGHFVHAARKNVDLTYIVMNNQIYGLTLGQASPSTQLGHITSTTPHGVKDPPLNPITLALGAGASFVARGYSGESKHLQTLVKKALEHKGFSLLDTLSPCVTFNRLNTYEWFNERIYKLENENHDSNNINAAFNKGLEWGDRIPLGVFYQASTPGDHSAKSYVDMPLDKGSFNIDLKEIFDEFR